MGLGGGGIHNGRSWWRLSQVWRKFAEKSTWLRFQKMHFHRGTKTVLAIAPSRGFRGRKQLILGTKWISLPILQPPSVFLSRFHLRVLSDTSVQRPPSWVQVSVGHWLGAWQKTTTVSICVADFRSELFSATSQLLEHWHDDPPELVFVYPTLGVLKLHPGMLQRTKDDPLFLVCSISVVFQPYYMKQPNERFHDSRCKFAKSHVGI